MRRFTGTVAAFLAALVVVAPANAQEKELLPTTCITERTASFNVQSWVRKGPDASALKRQFDSDILAIRAAAVEMGATKMGGMHYTITPEPGASSDFRLSGSVNFQMEPASNAIILLQRLQRSNYPVSLSFVEVNKAPGMCALNVAARKWQ